ncbi:Uncharacterised protein [Bordetella pertussis]|nr:Uncharacterised protein [Bordetella pertussis]CPJ38785.1 Uncharacterised protein [Bordetella pertussis]
MASISLPAVAGPMPGTSCATRKPASRERGFSAQRSTDSMSLTWAASRKRRPPNFTNGMLRRVSSSSSAALWLEARNSAACDLSVAPPSRCASTWSATQRAWPASSLTLTSSGRCDEARSVHSALA